MKFDIPKELEKFYDASKVDVYEIKYTHENNKLRAKEALSLYLHKHNIDSGYVSDSLVQEWMVHQKALELAALAARRIELEELSKRDRQQWEKDNTCQYCGDIGPLAHKNPLGSACPPCHKAAEFMAAQSYLTPVRVKSIGRKLGLK